MKRTLLLLLLVVGLAAPALAQPYPPPQPAFITNYNGAPPAGACSQAQLWFNGTLGALLNCYNGAWVAAGGGGGGGGLAPTGGTGFVVETAPGVTINRLFENTDGCLIWQNADGVSANPILNIDGNCVLAKSDLLDCDDANEALNYDVATDAFSCRTITGGSGGVDYQTTFVIFEDFMTGSTATTSTIGTTGMSFAAITSGTVNQIAGLATHPGILEFQPQTSDNGGAVIQWGSTAGLHPVALWTNRVWSYEAVVIPTVSVTSTAVWFGLSSTASGILTTPNFIGIRRDSDLTDTNHVFVVCDSATAGCQSAGDDTNQNYVAGTITGTAGTPVRFLITHDKSGPGSTSKISMSVGISGAMETAKTFCSSTCDDTLDNLPAGVNLIPVLAFVQRGASSGRTLQADYIKLTIEGLTRW